ncbi:hypothetical protein CYMTET_56558, partial [Cymbomonas tetramitiformis]
MRIVTWNIGLRGLRTLCSPHHANQYSEDSHGIRKKVSYGSLVALLNSLNADIICLQETKVSRSDLERDLALAPGWDSYFSCCRLRAGYSGVATFCRSEYAPIRAEEGFTGTLDGGARDNPVGPYGTLATEYNRRQLADLDLEGRCVVRSRVAPGCRSQLAGLDLEGRCVVRS